jgi:hypothetical protein
MALSLAACASIEPEPCTSEWVSWKKDRILKSFARSHTGDIGFVRDLRKTFDGGKLTPADALMLMTAAPRIERLVGDFVDRAAPEVRSAIARCGGEPRTAALFAEMLRAEGVDEEILTWIETLGGARDQTSG